MAKTPSFWSEELTSWDGAKIMKILLHEWSLNARWDLALKLFKIPMNDGSGNWTCVLVDFVYKRQAQKVYLTAVCAINFGNHAVQIQDTSFIPFFYGEKHADLGDSSICDRLFFTVSV